MSVYSIAKVLRDRDGLEPDEIAEAIEVARDRVLVDGENPEVVLEEEFGLEPDYVFDLLTI